MKLYDLAFSSNCRKVRIAAAELDLPLELVPVDPFTGGNRTPEYLGKNPMGKVPTLDDDGFVLYESTAICEYLAAQRPDRGLAPNDPRGRADLWRWMAWYSAHVQPWLSTMVFEQRLKPLSGGTTDAAAVAYARRELDRFMPVLEKHLASGREHLLERYSIADICVGVGMQSVKPAGLDMAPYPSIVAWVGRLESREAWKKNPVLAPGPKR